MNTHLYRIFKKVIAIVLALLLISTDTLQYAYATVDEYQGQEVISQDVSSQENIDNNEQTSDDQNEGIIDDKNLDIAKEELTKVNDDTYNAQKNGNSYTFDFYKDYLSLTITNTDNSITEGKLSKAQ